MRRLIFLPTLLLAFAGCKEEATEPIAVTAVTVTPATAQLASGAQLQLQIQITGSNGAALSDRRVSWSSSDPAVAQVSASGLVTGGRNLGNESASATITATVEGTSGTSELELLRVPVTSIEFSKASLRLAESDTTELAVTLKTADGTELPNREVSWQIADTTVLKRLDDGRIVATPYTGDADRTTTLTARVDSAEATLEAQVYVDWDRWTTYWEEVPGAFPSLTPYLQAVGGRAAMTLANPIDLTGDGRVDFLVHLWNAIDFEVLGPGYHDLPITNRLVAFVQGDDGRFRDGTAEIFGSQLIELDGASRDQIIADFNADGIDDIAYAMNREDGRWCVFPTPEPGEQWLGCLNQRSRTAVMISNGVGRFEVLQLDPAGWHHSIGTMVHNGRQTLVTDYRAYVFDGTVAQEVEGLPGRGNSGYAPFTRTPDIRGDHEYFLSYMSVGEYPPLPFLYSLAMWRRGAEWTLADTWGFRDWGTVYTKGYDSADWGEGPVIFHGGRNFLYGFFTEMCSWRPQPSSEPLFVGHFPAGEYVGQVSPGDSIGSVHTQATSLLFMYSIVGDDLIPVADYVSDDAYEVANVNFMECRDVNGDGLDDIVRYPYQQLESGPVPILLLNRNGALHRIANGVFPDPSDNEHGWTSVFAPSPEGAGDDLIFFPGNGCSVQTDEPGCTRLRFYRSRRPIR